MKNTYKDLLKTPKVEYILVLGSEHRSDDDLSITSQVKGIAINRLVEGIRHYKNLENVKLIVSGYGGFDKNSHAFMQERLAISLGVNPSDIIRLDSPKDTKEEAVETKILADKPYSSNIGFSYETFSFIVSKRRLKYNSKSNKPLSI